MAQVDTSIYARNPLRSVADYEAELRNAELQKQGLAQNKLALQTGRLKMDEYQRGVERTNALQGILSKFGGDTQANTQALVTGGFLKEAEGYQKSQYEAEKAKAENVKAMVDVLGKKIDQHKGLLSTVANPQMAAQWMQAAYQDPDLGKIMSRLGPLEQVVSSIPQDPQGFQNWLLQTSAGADKLRAQLAQEASAAETKANNLRVDARQKEQIGVSKGQLAVAQGNLGVAKERLALDKTKESPEAKKLAEKEQAKVADANDALSLLDMADELVGKATGSLGGAWVDKTAAAIGKSTEGAKAAAQLKAIEGMLVSKMPKMSGPQSDKDVLLYKQMAGQIGDETVPADQKRAAMSAIRKIQERYAGKTAEQQPANTPSVSNW